MASVLITPVGEDASPRSLNVFRVKKLCDNFHISVEYGKRLQKGGFLLKLCPEQNLQQLLRMEMIGSARVKITLPAHLNTIKGIIYHPELAYMDASEVELMLHDYEVQTVTKPPQAPYAICAWNLTTRSTLPATVLVGWDRVKVKLCIPRPRRCYCCHTYGHIAADCTKTPVCAQCGQDHDLDGNEACHQPPHCAACGGSHAANDPDCPTWKEEKTVAKIRYEEKISYSAAVKKMKKQEEAKKEDDKKEEEEQEEDDKKEEEEQEEDTEEETEEDEEEEEEEEAEAMQEDPQEDKNRRGRPIDKTDVGGWQVASSKKRRTHFSST